MTHVLKTYERQVNEIIMLYLAGTLKYYDAIRALRKFHISTDDAKALLADAVQNE